MHHESKILEKYRGYLDDESKLDADIEHQDRASRIILVAMMIMGIIRMAIGADSSRHEESGITQVDIIVGGLCIVAFFATRMRLHALYVIKALIPKSTKRPD